MQNVNQLYTKCAQNLNQDIISSLTHLYNTTNNEHKLITSRMDVQLAYINQYDKQWLDKKVSYFIAATDKKAENFNGILGEIRAYGDLLELQHNLFSVKKIKTPSSGSDFVMILDDNTSIHIEVNTPQQSDGKITSTEIEKTTKEIKNYKIEYDISAHAPYGYPGRKKDNIQYEAVSKFSQIKNKQECKQFKKDKISILWLDLNDPKISMFNQLDYTTPIISFNGAISSGFIWNAFYSLQGDKIYANHDSFSKDYIEMEFNGRFSNSYIDFVVLDCFTHKVIFENHNSKKEFPSEIYKLFLNFFNLNNQSSYLSFGNKKLLKDIIKAERTLSNSLVDL